ncbi:TetR/AcrR family transcriptional regulator [Bordetella sp. FB-8]|uniref:TetR/AcrR family transcriptional regulator n=1 Tax=Bordetella sp. FB-8 TaxID=1159870 RepID=UPI00036E1500|nr:TetR/AcrR family transcriptional regulator [Bordetella sp. FB-8]
MSLGCPFPHVGRRSRKSDVSGREELLNAAILLFAERGVANTTIAQIAGAVKVTPAMVHYWFDTRERLYDAVASERIVPLIEAVWIPVDFERDAILDLVRGVMRRMFAMTISTPWLPSLWSREVIQMGGMLRERVLSRISPEPSRLFREKIAQAQARGEINPDIEPELLFTSMVSLAMLPQASESVWCQLHFNGRVLSSRQIEDHTIALLMTGLTGPVVPRTTQPQGGQP